MRVTIARQPANITDTLRLLGALCVIWYHNPLYWSLHSHLESVNALKLVLLGWSMPFFYSTSAKFAFAGKSSAHLVSRIPPLVVLILFYTALYEFVRFLAGAPLSDLCGNGEHSCSVTGVFETIRGVANTPGYYLSDLVSIYILAFFASLNSTLKIAVTLALWCGLGLGYLRLGGVFLNPLAVGCLSVVLLYNGLKSYLLGSLRPIALDAASTIYLILFLILTWGILNYFVGRDDYWSHLFSAIPFMLVMVLFLSCEDIVSTNSPLSLILSQWGRKYAFGIFMFHQLCFDTIVPRGVSIARRLFSIQDEFTLYLLAGLLATTAATLITIVVRRVTPSLVMA